MKVRLIVYLAAALLAAVTTAPAAPDSTDTVDKIAVIVGDEAILASELANQIQMVAFQTGKRPESQDELLEFQKQVVEQMVSDKLFLMEARKDTTIEVRPEEVQQALDEHIARVIENFGSEDAFLKALSAEGMTLRDLRRQYEGEIQNNLLRQRYIQKKLYSVSVSKYEVEKFFNDFRDSIPDQPEGVKLAHILLPVRASKMIEDSVRAEAEKLRQRILDGADFATISSQYSSMGAGTNGGDLGFVESGDMVPEFAAVAFKLKEGEVSDVVRTQFGFHVVRCEGRRGEKAHLRHLLLAVVPSAQDTANTVALADSLMQAARNGGDFGEMAKTYSEDNDSRAQGGELGWFAVTQLPEDFTPVVKGWTTPGELRGPVKSKFGVHVLKLLDYQPAKVLTLDGDFDRIKEMCRQDKTGKMVDQWISQLKKKTYIDYRLEGFGG